MKITNLYFSLSLFSLVSLPLSSFAGGFDVNNLWSAKYSAVGGAAVSNVEGAQSVYFNPAGLSKSYSLELDLNINTAFTQKSAPVKPQGDDPTIGDDPKHTPVIYLPIVGFFGAKQINKRLGLGAGLYVVGGSGGEYKDINYGDAFSELRPDLESNILLFEFSVGAGYQLTPTISFGASWRPTFININAKAAAPTDLDLDGTPDILLAPELNDLSDIVLGGFRLGIQYRPVGANWGLGIAMRSENKFEAKGSTSGSSELANSGTKDSIDGGDVTAISRIPMRLSFGGHFDPSSQLRLMTQYDYTRNERVKELALRGDPLAVNGAGELPVSSFSIPFDWMNQHSFRFGTQYRLPEVWTLRAGYVFSTQVTREERATPTDFTPGNEQSMIIGAGREVRLFNKLLQLDLALEYVFSSGEGKNSKPGSLDGDYNAKAIGFFTALSYRM